jgi:hypothetical protein
MAEIPRRVGRQFLPSGRTEGVPIPQDIADTGAGIEAQGLGQLGAGVTNLGQAIGEIQEREKRAEDALAADSISNIALNAKDNIALAKQENPDPKSWPQLENEIWSGALEAASQQQFNDKDLGERVFLELRAERQHSGNITALEAAKRSADIAVTASRDTLIKNIARGEDVSSSTVIHQEALKNSLGDDKLVDIEMAETIREGEKQRVSVLNKERRFDEAKDLVLESTAFEADEANAILKLIESTEEHFKAETINLNREADLKVNEDFVSRIAEHNLLPDDVATSRLPEGKIDAIETDKLTKQSWLSFVDASNEPPPAATSPGGHNTATEIVFSFPRKISKETAYSRLLTLRYISRDITDSDFKWAIERIENPYPRSVSTDIESVTKSNTDSILNSGFFDRLITTDAERKKARDVNSELISWVERETEQGKAPTRQQMYNKSAELRSQSPQNIQQPVIINTQEEYDNLPSGTEFIDPKDGKPYRKQ